MPKTKIKSPITAAPPVEHAWTGEAGDVAYVQRVVTSIARLRGRNKLTPRQSDVAEMFRAAFETVMSSLGGSMDFERVRSPSGGARAMPEANLIAAETLRDARQLLGERGILIVEQIVCYGRTTEETARQLYGYDDREKVKARDANHIGRVLHEALTQLADAWRPITKSNRIRSFRTDKVGTSEEGVHNVAGIKPYLA